MKNYVLGTVIAAILIAVIAVAGVSQLRGGGGSEEASPSEASQQEVPQRPDCPAGTVAGVRLECLGGAATGKPADEGVAVVNVWAWWCEPCRAELPYLQDVADAHPDWQVVGVHADKNAGNGAAFLNDLGVKLPSFQDSDNKFAGDLGLPGVVPVTVVLKDGEVRKQFAQPFSSAAEIEKAVEEAIAA
ncbi:MAG: TlpA disulfide reductase family protein [Corynebacterium sp.]|nr:TlpA disulfide reductase family protein [Corynebacterium sp.]